MTKRKATGAKTRQTRKKPKSKARPGKGPGGRPPTRLTEHELAQIETMAGYGLTMAMIGDAIGIPERTLRLRKSDDAKVSAAFARGKARAEAVVGRALFTRASVGDVHAIRWWEMTRAGRREARSDEITGPGGEPLPPSVRVVLVRAPGSDAKAR